MPISLRSSLLLGSVDGSSVSPLREGQFETLAAEGDLVTKTALSPSTTPKVTKTAIDPDQITGSAGIVTRGGAVVVATVAGSEPVLDDDGFFADVDGSQLERELVGETVIREKRGFPLLLLAALAAGGFYLLTRS